MSDAWRPSASLAALQARAALYRQIRQFFDTRGVLEVETPQLAQYGVTDVNLDCISVAGYGYLQTSPEYHMKRLLAAGSGAIWQLCKSFRHGEAGRRHNPEFSLLEWYRPGFDLEQLIDEVVALLQLALPQRMPVVYRFRDAFFAATGLDPMVADSAALAAVARQNGEQLPDLDHAGWVDWLMATRVEPAFDPQALTVVIDFPAWAAALAETWVDARGTEVARRFEVYTGGVELANGYQELRDATEQRRRFDADRSARMAAGRPAPAVDKRLMAAITAGLPPVSGVALGVERLLMVMCGCECIDEVLAFTLGRA